MKKTKKLLSVFLSAVMLLSVFTLTGTYAEDEFIEDEPDANVQPFRIKDDDPLVEEELNAKAEMTVFSVIIK